MKPRSVWNMVLLLLAIAVVRSSANSQVLSPLHGPWGAKQAHPKLDSTLFQISEVYAKEGRQRALEFAGRRGVPLHGLEKVTVYLVAEPGKTTASIPGMSSHPWVSMLQRVRTKSSKQPYLWRI